MKLIRESLSDKLRGPTLEDLKEKYIGKIVYNINNSFIGVIKDIFYNKESKEIIITIHFLFDNHLFNYIDKKMNYSFFEFKNEIIFYEDELKELYNLYKHFKDYSQNL